MALFASFSALLRPFFAGPADSGGVLAVLDGQNGALSPFCASFSAPGGGPPGLPAGHTVYWMLGPGGQWPPGQLAPGQLALADGHLGPLCTGWAGPGGHLARWPDGHLASRTAQKQGFWGPGGVFP